MTDAAAVLLPHAPEVIHDLIGALVPGRALLVLGNSGGIAGYAGTLIAGAIAGAQIIQAEAGVDAAHRLVEAGQRCIIVAKGPFAASITRLASAPRAWAGRIGAIAAFGGYIRALCPQCACPATTVTPNGRRLAEAWSIDPATTLEPGTPPACGGCHGTGRQTVRPACFRCCVLGEDLRALPLTDAAREIEALFAPDSAHAHARRAAAAQRTGGVRLWSPADDLRARVRAGAMSLDDAAQAAWDDAFPKYRLAI